MEQGQNMVRNLVNKFRDASKQGSTVIIDGINQKGFTKEVAQEALNGVKRKGVKSDTFYRIVGDGFEINETVNAKGK